MPGRTGSQTRTAHLLGKCLNQGLHVFGTIHHDACMRFVLSALHPLRIMEQNVPFLSVARTGFANLSTSKVHMSARLRIP